MTVKPSKGGLQNFNDPLDLVNIATSLHRTPAVKVREVVLEDWNICANSEKSFPMTFMKQFTRPWLPWWLQRNMWMWGKTSVRHECHLLQDNRPIDHWAWYWHDICPILRIGPSANIYVWPNTRNDICIIKVFLKVTASVWEYRLREQWVRRQWL